MSLRSWSLQPVFYVLCCVLGCPAPASDDDDDDPPRPLVVEPEPSAPAQVADELRVLAWLDPDAPALAYIRLPLDLEPEALGELFALPPRALALMRAPLSFEAGLAALISPAAPAPDTWLARDAAIMQPPLARGPYLVRRLLAPRPTVEGWLRAGGMVSDTIEGLSVWTPGPQASEALGPDLPSTLAPAAVFPWRVVFLADDLIGAFSLAEIGHGLGPLTAARDLPPSELTRTVSERVTRDPDLLVELYAQGLMLHFDLSDDIALAKLTLRRGTGASIDGEVLLQSLGDASTARASLHARVPAGAVTEVLRELYTRVTFVTEGQLVRGHLLLAEGDLAPLRRGGGP